MSCKFKVIAVKSSAFLIDTLESDDCASGLTIPPVAYSRVRISPMGRRQSREERVISRLHLSLYSQPVAVVPVRTDVLSYEPHVLLTVVCKIPIKSTRVDDAPTALSVLDSPPESVVCASSPSVTYCGGGI